MTSEQFQVFAIAFVLLLNFGGLVWGASRIKLTADNLTIELGRLRKTVERVDRHQNEMETRLAVVEDRQERE